MQRAQDKTEQMRARAGALDELLAAGAWQDSSGWLAWPKRGHSGSASESGTTG